MSRHRRDDDEDVADYGYAEAPRYAPVYEPVYEPPQSEASRYAYEAPAYEPPR